MAGTGRVPHEVGHMANLQRILKRQPGVEEAELELVRSRVLVRLEAMSRGGGAESRDDAPGAEASSDVIAPGDDGVGVEAAGDPSSRMTIAPLAGDGQERAASEGVASVDWPAADVVRFDPSAIPVLPDVPSPAVTISALGDDAGGSTEPIDAPAAGRVPVDTDRPAPRLVSIARPANVARAAKAEADGWDDERPDAPPVTLAAMAVEPPIIRARRPARPPAAVRKARPSAAARKVLAPVESDVIEAGPPGEALVPVESDVIEAGPPVEALAPVESDVIEAGPPTQEVLFTLDGESALAIESVEPPAIEIDPPEASASTATEPSRIERDPDVPPRAGPRQPARATRTAGSKPHGTSGDRRPAQASPQPPDPADPAAYCPYCATVLQPPPDATRRCPRCRQRIVVRHVGTRTVYLAEAALPVFEAERRRAANAERWGRDRDRWLDLAREAGASADRMARSAREPFSEASVTAARALYLATVDQSYRTARSERRWEEAASIRYDQALVLFRIAGSPSPPPDDVVRVHREGLAAALHGIGEVAKDAELRGAPCCESCGADQGRIVRIAEELRSPRLPHPGCPKGLCRCRWFISGRDQAFLSEFLRRQARANRRLSAPTES